MLRLTASVVLISLALVGCGHQARTSKTSKPQGLVRLAHPRVIDDLAPVFVAVAREELDTVKKMVDKDPSLINAVARREKATLMHYAARGRDTALASWLLSKGLSPNVADGKDSVPLSYASSPEMVKLLMEKGANPGLQDKDGRTPIFFASINALWGASDKNIDIGYHDDTMINGRRVMPPEARKWLSEYLTPMLTSQEVIDKKDKFGRTALHYMSGTGEVTVSLYTDMFDGSSDAGGIIVFNSLLITPEIGRLLIEHGADVNAVDKKGCTPLHYVSSVELAELLISKGAQVDARDNLGATPLYYVARAANSYGSGNPNLIDYLVSKGAEVNARDKKNRTPLYYANKKAQASQASAMVMALKKHGAKLK